MLTVPELPCAIHLPKEDPGKFEGGLELLLGADEVDGVLVDGGGQLLEELLLGQDAGGGGDNCGGNGNRQVAGQLPHWPVRVEF